jgi:hypothetical protein
MVWALLNEAVLSQAMTRTQTMVGIQASSKRRRDVVGLVNNSISSCVG